MNLRERSVETDRKGAVSAPRGAVAGAPGSSARPRALLVVPTFEAKGGAERRAGILRRSLTSVDVEAAVFLSPSAHGPHAGAEVHGLGWKGLWSYPAVIVRLRRLLAQRRYDVVMAFGLYPNFVTWFATRAMSRNPAVVLTEITRPYRASLTEKPRLRRVVNRWLMRLVYGRGDWFAANSIDGVEESIRYFGVKRDTARRLGGIIDSEELETLARQAPCVEHDPLMFTICTSARFDAMKRLDTLLHAVAGLPSHLSWRLILIGDGKERANLEALARRLGIASRVRFTGWTTNPFPIVAASSVYVHCSEWEGLSNAVLEAMFLKVPVATSFCSSDAREMSACGAALGFETGDANALSSHLENLMCSSELRERLRTQGVQYCRRHEKSASVADYDALLLRAAQMHAARD